WAGSRGSLRRGGRGAAPPRRYHPEAIGGRPVPWDPAQYLKFGDHRLRPAIDLLNRIDLDAPGAVYDLGCGAGNVTRQLVARWPDAHVVGVDSSEAMLAKARATLPNVDWRPADLSTWRPAEPPDLIYSNAALHWLGDHAQLFP